MRIMIKKSVADEICRYWGLPLVKSTTKTRRQEFLEIKGELLAHIRKLRKQEEASLKKACWELEKSFALEKATGKKREKADNGTIRTWGDGKKYRRVAPGKWVQVFNDDRTRGAKQSLRYIEKKIASINDERELMWFVQHNKEKFVDNWGYPLPAVERLSELAHKRNDEIVKKKNTIEKKKESYTNPECTKARNNFENAFKHKDGKMIIDTFNALIDAEIKREWSIPELKERGYNSRFMGYKPSESLKDKAKLLESLEQRKNKMLQSLKGDVVRNYQYEEKNKQWRSNNPDKMDDEALLNEQSDDLQWFNKMQEKPLIETLLNLKYMPRSDLSYSVNFANNLGKRLWRMEAVDREIRNRGLSSVFATDFDSGLAKGKETENYEKASRQVEEIRQGFSDKIASTIDEKPIQEVLGLCVSTSKGAKTRLQQVFDNILKNQIAPSFYNKIQNSWAEDAIKKDGKDGILKVAKKHNAELAEAALKREVDNKGKDEVTVFFSKTRQDALDEVKKYQKDRDYLFDCCKKATRTMFYTVQEYRNKIEHDYPDIGEDVKNRLADVAKKLAQRCNSSSFDNQELHKMLIHDRPDLVLDVKSYFSQKELDAARERAKAIIAESKED